LSRPSRQVGVGRGRARRGPTDGAAMPHPHRTKTGDENRLRVGGSRERTRARVPHSTDVASRRVGRESVAACAVPRRRTSRSGAARRGAATFAARGSSASVRCGTRGRVRSRRGPTDGAAMPHPHRTKTGDENRLRVEGRRERTRARVPHSTDVASRRVGRESVAACAVPRRRTSRSGASRRGAARRRLLRADLPHRSCGGTRARVRSQRGPTDGAAMPHPAPDKDRRREPAPRRRAPGAHASPRAALDRRRVAPCRP
jgi:hypothetical protein